MAENYLAHITADAAAKAQRQYYGSVVFPQSAASAEADPLGPDEVQFIQRRDSFYVGSISETGWPYIQHRGGPMGFLRVLSPRQLGFLDLRGNRQMIFTGNVSLNPKVSLFLMDYPRRERLKILGTARVLDAREHPDMVEKFGSDAWAKRAERVVLIEVLSFDWNCPKFIAPRYSAPEVHELVEPLKERIRELETALNKVKL